MNQGIIKDDKYIKQVEFSKAVLWRDRMISLNLDVTSMIRKRSPQWIWFEDQKKNERWIIRTPDFFANSVVKTVGQEKQFYCPISLFDREVIRKIDIKPISQEVRPQQEKMF